MSRIARLIGPAIVALYAVTGCSRHAPAATPAPPAASAGAASPSSPPPPFVRPALVAQTGQYFTWLMPAGWKPSETANGVDMSSPDGTMIASSVLLTLNMGQSDPWSFVTRTLTAIGVRDIRQISEKDLPAVRSGYPRIDWQVKEFELSCTDATGSARRAEYTCGICNAYGGYSAMIQDFSCPPAEYDHAKTWMPMLAESVRATDPGKVAYYNTVMAPRNHSLDNSGLMESWEARRRSQDHIAQEQHETTMGYERMVSPIDGQHYDMPFEAYDSVKGGYRDPADPHELLKHAPPGE